MSAKPIEPIAGVIKNLVNVDQAMNQIVGKQTVEATMAHASVAQVFATCALVHAVRELTEEIRKGRAGS